MRKKVMYSLSVFVLLLMTSFLPSATAEDDDDIEYKDSDQDGVPDHLDDNGNNTNVSDTDSVNKTGSCTDNSFSYGNWSIDYDSDTYYGAWIGDVYWNNSLYIRKANVPWIELDGVKYEIPNDFTLQESNDTARAGYHLVYQIYTKTIDGVNNHTVEVLWKFYNASVSNAGKIEMSVLHSVNHNNQYELFAPFRIDFDIIGSSEDQHYCYGSFGWSAQGTEAPQATYTPVDPTWGMKVKQDDYFNSNRWGGIKAWNTTETNYLLKYHANEYKGDPADYLDSEETDRTDNVLWTTASTTGSSPRACGPTVYVH